MTGKTFGRYEVEDKLAEGAMGTVYRAWDPLAQRRVAVKAVKDDVVAQDPTGDYLRRFQREARAAGGLSHPNIITIYDVGEKYFVMELLEGTSLLDYLDQKGPLALSAVIPIISPLASALSYAHGQGVFHRDIKPANIMVLPDGTPKLMDFGLAHLESTLMTASGQVLGSPSYMSPEQIKGEPMSPQTDLYALSVVTYEMLTGHKPFPGKNITTVIHRVIHEEPVPPRDWNKELPTQYNDIFRRALAKEPRDRFAHFSELLTALHMEELDSIQLPVPDVPRPVASELDEAWEAVETMDFHRLPVAEPKPVEDYIEAGLHEIRVEKAGFRTWSQTVEARTGESLNLVARLARLPAGSSPKTRPVK